MTTKTPKAPKAPKTTHFSVAAWNERSFPRMTKAQYHHDLLGPSSGWAKVPVDVWLGSEFDKGEIMNIAREYTRKHGISSITRYVETPDVHQGDVAIFLKRRRGIRVYSSHAYTLGNKPAPHNPARRYVATWANVGGFKVVFIAVHFTAGCFNGYRNHPTYLADCKALAAEVAELRHRVALEVKNGWTVVIGGDTNSQLPIDWAPGQSDIGVRHLMQLAVVPAKGVHVKLSHLGTCDGLHTDHPLVSTHVTLSR